MNPRANNHFFLDLCDGRRQFVANIIRMKSVTTQIAFTKIRGASHDPYPCLVLPTTTLLFLLHFAHWRYHGNWNVMSSTLRRLEAASMLYILHYVIPTKSNTTGVRKARYALYRQQKLVQEDPRAYICEEDMIMQEYTLIIWICLFLWLLQGRWARTVHNINSCKHAAVSWVLAMNWAQHRHHRKRQNSIQQCELWISFSKRLVMRVQHRINSTHGRLWGYNWDVLLLMFFSPSSMGGIQMYLQRSLNFPSHALFVPRCTVVQYSPSRTHLLWPPYW